MVWAGEWCQFGECGQGHGRVRHWEWMRLGGIWAILSLMAVRSACLALFRLAMSDGS